MYLSSCYFPQSARLASAELRRTSAQIRRRFIIELMIEDAKIHNFKNHKFKTINIG